MNIVSKPRIFRFWVILQKPAEKVTASLDTQRSINIQELKDPKQAFIRKIKLIPSLMKFMIPLGLVYLFEYFINQGTVSLVLFVYVDCFELSTLAF